MNNLNNFNFNKIDKNISPSDSKEKEEIGEDLSKNDENEIIANEFHGSPIWSETQSMRSAQSVESVLDQG